MTEFSSSYLTKGKDKKGKERWVWNESNKNINNEKTWKKLKWCIKRQNLFLSKAADWKAVQNGWQCKDKEVTFSWFTATGTIKLEGIIEKTSQIFQHLHSSPIALNEEEIEKEPAIELIIVPDTERQGIPQYDKPGIKVLKILQDGSHESLDIRSYLESKLQTWKDIYTVSPFLDAFGLGMILANVTKESLTRMYVRKKCNGDDNFTVVLQQCQLPSRWISDDVTKKLYPIGSSKNPAQFHGKWFAGTNSEGKKEVVVTSCNLTVHHMNYNQLETVTTLEMSDEDFRQRWESPFRKIANVNDSLGMENLEI